MPLQNSLPNGCHYFMQLLHSGDQISTLLHDLSSTTKRLIVIHDSLVGYLAQDVFPPFSTQFLFTMYASIWEAARKPNIPEVELLKGLLESCFSLDLLEFAKLQQAYNKFNCGYLCNSCREMEGRCLDFSAQAFLSQT